MPVLDPGEMPCFKLCSSCYRCQDKGSRAICKGCSGRPDPLMPAGIAQIEGVRVHLMGRRHDPYDIDNACRCKEGVLQYRVKRGKLIIRRFLSDPFGGKVTTDAESEDDRDWNAYVNDKRERLNNEFYDPLTFGGGGSVTDWMSGARRGPR